MNRVPDVQVGPAVERPPVGDPRSHYRGLESGALRHRPGRREAAVAPAADPEPFRVGDSAVYQVIEPGQHVPEILAAHVADIRLRERHAPAGGAAVVRHEHCDS